MSTVYSAVDTFLKSALQGTAPLQEGKDLDFQNPFRFFESLPRDVDAGMYNWRAMEDADRLKRVQSYERTRERQQAESPSAFKVRNNRWKRDLLFIIQEECRAEGGSRPVAAVAFNLLFPKEA
jgi:hypothetical protein